MAEWTPEDVRKVLLNPVHAMGPNPTVPAEKWVTAQTMLLREMGKRQYFHALLEVVTETFGPFVREPAEPDDGETSGPDGPSSN